MNELQITEQIQAPILSLNFAELEAQAIQIAQTYTSIAITDDTYMSAKNDAKKLAGYVNDIEKKRKEIKRQAEEPIKAFDSECKRIEQILLDAKTSIEGVTVKYDEDRKAERAKKIKDYVDKQLSKSGLRPEYIAKLVEPANAQNLSSTLKSIKEDYDAQIARLQQEQHNYDQLMIIAKTMVDASNEKISQKMTVDSFQTDIEHILQTELTPAEMSEEISKIIRTKADAIAEAEERIRNEVIEAERQKQAELQSQIDAETEAPVAAPAVAPEAGPGINNNPAPPSDIEENPFAKHISEVSVPVWEGTLKLTGSVEGLQAVIACLQEKCREVNVQLSVESSKQIS